MAEAAKFNIELCDVTSSADTPEVVVLDFRGRSLDGVFIVMDEFIKLITYELDNPVKSVDILCIILGILHAEVKDRVLSVLDGFKQSGVALTLGYAYAEEDFEGLFFCKSLVDLRQNDTIGIVTSTASYASLRAATELLFPPSYRIRFRIATAKPSAVTELWGGDTSSALEKCTSFLRELPPFSGEKLQILTSDSIPSDVFIHGFTTRYGGCSTFSSMSSLNMRYDSTLKDSVATVAENQRRVAKEGGFDPARFYLTRAAHGVNVWVLDDPEPVDYDAITTNQSGITIAATGADCVTVILADPVHDACAVVHSGWRGTLGNIVGETIRAMVSRNRSDVGDIRAVIGPSIGVCCFNEIGVGETYKATKDFDQFVENIEGDSVPHVNLQEAIKSQLLSSGLLPHHVDDTSCNMCTCCNENKFFSYHRDGKNFGVQIGFIGLRALE